jgi:hypothetical protein
MGRAKPVTLLPLIALIFYEVSGGPFGIEVGAGWVDGWESWVSWADLHVPQPIAVPCRRAHSIQAAAVCAVYFSSHKGNSF